MRKDYMVALNSTAGQFMAGSCDLLSQFLGWCLVALAQQPEVRFAGIDEVRQAMDSSSPHAPARAPVFPHGRSLKASRLEPNPSVMCALRMCPHMTGHELNLSDACVLIHPDTHE